MINQAPTLYRVMLDGEDGVYCQADGFQSEDSAFKWCFEHDDYSEDRSLFVEPYYPMGIY